FFKPCTLAYCSITFVIVFFINLFAIMYVWQNIEVMKINLQHRKLDRIEKNILNSNDKLKYWIERYKRTKVIEQYARVQGLKKVVPGDYEVLIIRDKKNKGKSIH
ncbi:hypothetical protein ACFL20_04205, partial [Spirochaetota bacterium]